MLFNYHTNLDVLHLNCEKPRAYFIPFESAEASGESRGKSRFFKSLCGTWDFKYFESIGDAECLSGIEDGTEPSDYDKITVPQSWQTVLGRTYDAPQYLNISYPFPVEPPHLPDKIPCGLYKRDFFISAGDAEKKEIYINFEGVDSCFYLFINNRFAAYSQVSHSTSEINITKYLNAGSNNIKVLVLKWCDGSYLEDQDKWRMSGIFREVYLLFRDKNHITDIFAKPCVGDDLKSGKLTVEFEANSAIAPDYVLFSPDKREIASGKARSAKRGSFEIDPGSLSLWSDETPDLYTLIIHSENEYINLKIGFIKREIHKDVVYINGKKVKARGVNRHDSHPMLGSAVPYEHMLNDILIMKRHNVNMVRTSHYPNDPRFYELCDKYGIYVVNEADIETHGMQTIGAWSLLSDSPEWKAAYIDRAERLVERDKNHASVLMWSLGNESGFGENHMEMSRLIRERDSSRFIHYEGANKNEFVPGAVDIDSHMYAPPEKAEAYCRDKSKTQPYFQCEYSHAMGNGPGDLKTYFDLTLKYDSYFGGCIWEFCDHSVNTGSNERPRYTYGGDFSEALHDSNFCVDGLVYPDRRPHTGLLEAKEIYAPLRASLTDAKTGRIQIESLREFKSLGDISLVWSLESNSKTTCQGRIASLGIKPRSKKSFVLGYTADPDKYNYLNLSFRLNKKTDYCEAGYEIAHAQFEVSVPASRRALKPTGEISASDSERFINISAGDVSWRVNKNTGLVESITDNKTELLEKPVCPNIWRAPLDNDKYLSKVFEQERLSKMNVKCYSCGLSNSEAHSVTVTSRLSLAAAARTPIMELTVTYTFKSSGELTVKTDARRTRTNFDLPRFGYEIVLPEKFENLEYFGMGPGENYADKCLASRVGLFKTTVSENFEPYIHPQDNSNHHNTRFASVSHIAGQALMFASKKGFDFNAQHFSAKTLSAAKHDFELTPDSKTYVYVDYKTAGTGSNSCGPSLDRRYAVSDAEFSFEFTLKSGTLAYLDGFDLI